MEQSLARRVGWVVVVVLALAGPARGGGLSFIGQLRDGADGVDGLAGAFALAFSPDGAQVYVVGADDDAVAVLARNASNGVLSFVGVVRNGTDSVQGLRLPSAIVVSPDGANVYVASKDENALVVFARSPTTGALTFVEVVRKGSAGVDGIDHASGVAVSPDGVNVYATGEHDNAVAVFARGPTGALTFVEVHRDGVGGVAGIHRPTAVTLSPDGANVYVAGGAADGLGVFSRDPVTGALTFLEAETYGENARGVDRPNSLVVTSDGASLYVAGHDDDGVAAFSRDLVTGALTFVEIEDRHGAPSGLDGAFAVTADPDGRYVFAAGENDHTVSTLRRDPATSALTFVEAQRDGRFGVDGLRRASAVVVSPDGAHLYGVGHDDDAVAAFTIDRCGNGATGADEQCDDGNLTAGDGCSATCRLELCGSTPAPGCRPPVGTALLSIVRKPTDARDALSWRWTKGAATTRAEFGAPATTAAYMLCVYDSSGAPQPLMALAAPSDGSCAGVPCWTETGAGFLYRDRLWTPDGLALVRLHEGKDGDAKVIVTGRGAHLALPTLPLTTPVVVQLSNTETGVCWEATYGDPITNDSERFRSESD